MPRHVCSSASRPLRPAVGEPRRALGRPRLARGLPRRPRRAEPRAGPRAPGDGHSRLRAGGAPRGRHRHPAPALRREEGLASGALLSVRGRERRAAAHPAAASDLDRQQSHRTHLEGRRERGGLGGGAELPAGGAACRWLDDQQGEPRAVPRAMGAHHRHGARGGPRPRAPGQRALSQHQHQRGPRRPRSTRARPSSTPTTRASSRRPSWRAGRSRAAPPSAWPSSAPTPTPGWATSRSA